MDSPSPPPREMMCAHCAKPIKASHYRRILHLVEKDGEVIYFHFVCGEKALRTEEYPAAWFALRDFYDAKIPSQPKPSQKAYLTRLRKGTVRLGSRPYRGSRSGMAASAYGF